MILTQACHDAVLGMQQGKWDDNFHLHVNLSVNQLSQAGLLDELQAILSQTKLPAKNLLLEITESRLVDNDPVTIQNMQAIRDLGIQSRLMILVPAIVHLPTYISCHSTA